MNQAATGDDYSSRYFGNFRSTSRSSADVVTPLLIDWFSPGSVIDLGCGTGQWLASFEAAGVGDIRGVDGAYVDPEQRAISDAVFTTHDLAEPYQPERRYDLAMSVEVAEHLEPEQGAALVRSLTEASDIVFFSAASPHQAGVRHINCQWPEYWSAQFRDLGYVAFDAIRPRFWNDTRIDWWYRQNALIYIHETRASEFPDLAAHRTDAPLPLVHPELLATILEWGMSMDEKYWALWKECQGQADGE